MQNIKPQIWGEPGWVFLHSITMSYPNYPTPTDKHNFKYFFLNLQNMLPCEKCRINYKYHLLKHPLTNEILCHRDHLIQWLINIRNDLLISMNKPILSLKDILNKMENNNDNDNNNNIKQQDSSGFSCTTILLLIIIIVLIYYIYFNKIYLKKT
jgi:ATP-dependent Zn protease